MTDSLDLEAVKARVEAATEGPWAYDRGLVPPDGPQRYSTISAGGDLDLAEVNDLILSGIANATFIAHARTDVPALIAEVERLRGVTDATAKQAARAAIIQTEACETALARAESAEAKAARLEGVVEKLLAFPGGMFAPALEAEARTALSPPPAMGSSND